MIDSILISTVNSWLFFKNISQLPLIYGKTSSRISSVGARGCKGIKSLCTFYNNSFAGYQLRYSIVFLVSNRLLVLSTIAMFGYRSLFVQLSYAVTYSFALLRVFLVAHLRNFGSHQSTFVSWIVNIQIHSITTPLIALI